MKFLHDLKNVIHNEEVPFFIVLKKDNNGNPISVAAVNRITADNNGIYFEIDGELEKIERDKLWEFF